MRTLFFDTETTGLPIRDAGVSHEEQPGLVQFAALLHDGGGREVASASLIVDSGRYVSAAASEIHGITPDIVSSVGVPEKAAVGLFYRLVNQCDVIVAHNVDFDLLMMNIAASRAKIMLPSGGKLVRCTMRESAPILNLPPTERMKEYGHGDKPKAPRLEEAYRHFFGEELTGAHDALVDVRACARIYYELVARGSWKAAA